MPKLRPDLHFTTLDAAIADARRLLEAGYERGGNWTLGQIAEHLTYAIDGALDGVELKVPLPIRLVGPWVKGWFLKKGLPSGIKLTGGMAPLLPPEAEAISDAAGFEHLADAARRFSQSTAPARHPIFGRLTHDEWHRFHCRHCELHLGFLRERRETFPTTTPSQPALYKSSKS